MAAVTHYLQLANSEGLEKVVIFTGLSQPMLVHPFVYGEPVLTAQAFYFLNEMESVAKIRITSGEKNLSEAELEYLVDNYLFAYSKVHLESMMTFKISRSKFWMDDARNFYLDVDLGHAECLAIDVSNDPSVHEIRAIDAGDNVDLGDWDIGRNYAKECFDPYTKSLAAMLEKKVFAFITPDDYHDGYVGKMRVLRTQSSMITSDQAMRLNDLSLRSLPVNDKAVSLDASDSPFVLEDLIIERIETQALHAPVLLSHYFSGLKERNPLKRFVGFYNVLEYYFEEAPLLIARTAKVELAQLRCVIDWLIGETDLNDFLSKLDVASQLAIFAEIQTSSGVSIQGLDRVNLNRDELGRWLYDIRCAVVHSKKTRKGAPTPSFEPYTDSGRRVMHSIPVLQWLAILCIEKDYDLRQASSHEGGVS
jgi:hypothetical protein